MPPGKKQSGEQNQISWGFSQNVARIDETTRSFFLLLQQSSLVSLYFECCLGYTVTTNPRNLTSFHHTISPCEKVGSWHITIATALVDLYSYRVEEGTLIPNFKVRNFDYLTVVLYSSMTKSCFMMISAHVATYPSLPCFLFPS